MDRYRRRWEAARFLGHLWPDMSYWPLRKLVELAVDYWERPERFA